MVHLVEIFHFSFKNIIFFSEKTGCGVCLCWLELFVFKIMPFVSHCNNSLYCNLSICLFILEETPLAECKFNFLSATN